MQGSWRTFRAAVDGAHCAGPSSDCQCGSFLAGTQYRRMVPRKAFDDPHSGRRHALLWRSHPCEAQCKIRLDTTLCSLRCSGSTCSTLDLAGRLVRFGCCAGSSLCLSTETLTALVKIGKQLCKTRCFRRRKGLCRVPLTVGT